MARGDVFKALADPTRREILHCCAAARRRRANWRTISRNA